MNIIHHIPGRLRLQSSKLKEEEHAFSYEQNLKKLLGIESIYINRRIGSVLIKYNKNMPMGHWISQCEKAWEDTFDEKGDYQKYLVKSSHKKNHLRSLVNTGLVVTTLGTYATVLLWNKKWHGRFGWMMSGVLMTHVYLNKKALKRSIKRLVNNEAVRK